ncbi:SMC-Scp complex subunit ScpB [Thioalkalivibrio sp. XN8]|uniref:SMC-Scp complex subunit ScpB n=1 Tax=Thioalkalivibrio sp. XN8 TaxID=2712863 RepID=UPI0013EBD8F5|nr:SMC-Scp complex subunit ScpB [Thioalkalivibrio sp. XN8]NGP54597.1 SMC-Scp complex subunit ScpB [Thioalkalivibrio sp. XN8]
MEQQQLKNIVEAALLAAGRPMSIEQLLGLFGDSERPERADLRAALDALQEDYAERGIQLKEVASGWRIQVREELSNWLSRLWQDRPARYSRALLETLALIAYRQPITRGEIEDIRGVSVSSNIMRTLMERGWVRIVGHRDVPGRPGMYATTREFLDYFGLKRLEDLPPLAEIRDLDSINVELDLGLAEPASELPQEEVAEDEEEAHAEPAEDADRA